MDQPASPAGLREPLLTFLGATLLAAALSMAGLFIPFLGRYLGVLIAAIFLYAPGLAGRWSGRGFDYREAGLRLDPPGLNLRVLAVALAVTFPLFAVAFFVFYGVVCGPHGGFIQPMFAALCPRWRGLAHGVLRLPPEFLTSALNQLIVVAIPEELFFRGYLMQRLDQRWPPTRRLLGASIGPGLLVSSVLFAIGHVLVVPNPQRLAVVFPALVFGWMRARTGSIMPGALFHALCNLFADVLHTSYF
ncbi:MAG TPA: type II CAAX endopeptidase family protein [Polyangia bacterium]|nr:type II CAAX endopeptidase family protein [Polyangia bacterium]